MKTALLIIDVQRSMFEAAPWQADRLIGRIVRLIAAARQAAAPVVFVRDRRVEPDGRLHPDLDARPDDLHIEKNFCDAFLDTALDAKLRTQGVEKILVAGLQTDFCVDTTCRRAASLGYKVNLVGDAHSTYDHDHLRAEQIVAHHNHILRRFAAGKGAVTVVTSSAVAFV
jgi:nicotinamidase-related amidase